MFCLGETDNKWQKTKQCQSLCWRYMAIGKVKSKRDSSSRQGSSSIDRVCSHIAANFITTDS